MQNDNFNSSNTQQPLSPYQQPYNMPPPRKRSVLMRVLLAATAVIVALGIGVGVAYYMDQSKGAKPAAQDTVASQTFYYRDGKTVLDDAPAFKAHVLDQLQAKYGGSRLKQGEWSITTTLDPALQKTAKDQVQTAKAALTQRRTASATFMAQDVSNGQILSWVNGWDETASSGPLSNKKTEWGMLMLPVVYGAYFDSGKGTADTMLDDTRGVLPGWPCNNVALPAQGGNCLYNYDQKFLGPLSAKQALGGMRLVPAVKAAVAIKDTSSSPDFTHIVQAAKTLGGDGKCYEDQQLTTEASCSGAAVLGDGLFAQRNSMLHAYATLANEGKKLPQAVWLQVTHDGKAIDKWQQPKSEQAIKAAAANNVRTILADSTVSYLGKQSDLFVLPGNKAISTVAGLEMSGTQAAALQFTQRYVAALWVTADGSAFAGAIETSALAVTHGWLAGADK